MIRRQWCWTLVIVLCLSSFVSATGYLGTDLAFVHLIRNKAGNSTADARPLFNVFYLHQLNDYLLLNTAVDYQWNQFTGGLFWALKFKGGIGFFKELRRSLLVVYCRELRKRFSG